MKTKTIGIISGAGPLAGSYLLERIFSLSISKYGCYKDCDFPKVFLLNFPFSEMLAKEIDSNNLRNELKECIDLLRKNNCNILAIACNTLHAFLDSNDDYKDLVKLPKITGSQIPLKETPIVLCTSTSKKFGVHKDSFRCEYPSESVQLKIDLIIDQILKGKDPKSSAKELVGIMKKLSANVIVLGCTELSLISKYFSQCNKLIIDPLEIMANKILEISFCNKRI